MLNVSNANSTGTHCITLMGSKGCFKGFPFLCLLLPMSLGMENIRERANKAFALLKVTCVHEMDADSQSRECCSEGTLEVRLLSQDTCRGSNY